MINPLTDGWFWAIMIILTPVWIVVGYTIVDWIVHL